MNYIKNLLGRFASYVALKLEAPGFVKGATFSVTPIAPGKFRRFTTSDTRKDRALRAWYEEEKLEVSRAFLIAQAQWIAAIDAESQYALDRLNTLEKLTKEKQ